MYFYDTNALIHADLSKEDTFVVSSISLQELESIKVNKSKTDELRAKVRHLTHWLDKNEDKFQVVIYDQAQENLIKEKGIEITPDSKICAGAVFSKGFCHDNNLIFVTDDISCKNIARKIFGLDVISLGDQEERIYKGYRRINGNTNSINEQMANFDLSTWNTNEYLLINNIDDDSEKEMRFDGEKFVALKLPPSKYIKGKNSLQRCALDLLSNPDITIAAILGGYGSGKSYLTMQMGLYSVREKGWQSKILGVREVLGEGKEIGFLPGEKESKIGDFFLPLAQQLDGGEYELEMLKQQGVLEVNTPFFMKGTTYNETVMLVDEAEDLSEKQIRLIGTRLGDKSRIILNGDFKQSVINASSSNALVKMCNAFKDNPMFGCIYLGEDVRSTTSKMFANLFND